MGLVDDVLEEIERMEWMVGIEIWLGRAKVVKGLPWTWEEEYIERTAKEVKRPAEIIERVDGLVTRGIEEERRRDGAAGIKIC